MIETPSLRGRVMLAGMALLALVTVVLDVLLYLSLRDRLAEANLQRLVALESVGTAAVLVLAVLVLWRVTRVITRPVDRIVEVADEIAAGRTGARLEPTEPGTELGRMAAAFDRTVDAMERALRDARRAEDTSRRFLADAAHQLRTPMAGLRASSESLLRDPDLPGREVLLANIARESVRASRLVDDLLQVARLERGEAVIRERVDVAALVREECERVGALTPHVAFEVTAGEGEWGVQADRRGLKDAIANVLDNAGRHADSRVDVGLVRGFGTIEVVVVDDGPGVPAGEEERVFDRFVSLDGRGSGLGLPIARGVARAHGGDVVAEGSRFTIILPTAAV